MNQVEHAEQQERIAREMVATWASVIDVVLQDYLKAREVSDQATAVAMAKIVQASILMTDYFKEGLSIFLEDDQETQKACQEAAHIIYTVLDKRIDDVCKMAEALEPHPAVKGLLS